jgi:predicted TIM-barrel fold metal-dependent hydrolase
VVRRRGRRPAHRYHLLTNRERRERKVGVFSTFSSADEQCAQSYWVERALGQMIIGGVFERHPHLHVVAAEYEAGWSAFFAYNLDLKYKFHVFGAKTGRWREFKDGALPSDFCKRNIWITWQEDGLAVRIRNEIGVDRLMWGSDYPHASGTFPRSREILDDLLAGVPADDAAAMVGTNAAKLYGFEI